MSAKRFAIGTSLGTLVGRALAVVVARGASAWLAGSEDGAEHAGLILAALTGGLEGASVAIAQMHLARLEVAPKRWITATVASYVLFWAGAALAASLEPDLGARPSALVLYAALAGGLFGFLVGAAQAVAARSSLEGLPIWLGWSTAGWAAGLVVIAILADAAVFATEAVEMVIGLAASALGGLVAGLVQGSALGQLVPREAGRHPM